MFCCPSRVLGRSKVAGLTHWRCFPRPHSPTTHEAPTNTDLGGYSSYLDRLLFFSAKVGQTLGGMWLDIIPYIQPYAIHCALPTTYGKIMKFHDDALEYLHEDDHRGERYHHSITAAFCYINIIVYLTPIFVICDSTRRPLIFLNGLAFTDNCSIALPHLLIVNQPRRFSVN